MGGQISIHALREEGDGSGFSVVEVLCLFLSTPSARRATPYQQYCINRIVISIHALREEGDSTHDRHKQYDAYFYPRPPRGGRLVDVGSQAVSTHISIHALREEGDISTISSYAQYTLFLSTPSARRATWKSCKKSAPTLDFYPRPPRGGRLRRQWLRRQALQFLSTPSARRATGGVGLAGLS